MVSFQCDQCQETIKKPKLEGHLRSCGSYSASCLDCGVSFDQTAFKSHTSCVSEAQKYQGKLFKGDKKSNAGGAAGGAAKRKADDATTATAAAPAADEKSNKKSKKEAPAAAEPANPVVAVIKEMLAGTGDSDKPKPAVSLKALKKAVIKKCVAKPRTDEQKAAVSAQLVDALLTLPIAVSYFTSSDD